jgi:hypothetical protein
MASNSEVHLIGIVEIMQNIYQAVSIRMVERAFWTYNLLLCFVEQFRIP